MRRDKLLGMYINVLSNAKAKQFVNQIFSKYDTDNSGSIDFKVYLCLKKVDICQPFFSGIYDGDHDVRRPE